MISLTKLNVLIDTHISIPNRIVPSFQSFQADTLIDKLERAQCRQCKFYAIAKEKFKPTTNYGLKFNRHEELRILDCSHENIWIASDERNKTGFVPARLLAKV